MINVYRDGIIEYEGVTVVRDSGRDNFTVETSDGVDISFRRCAGWDYRVILPRVYSDRRPHSRACGPRPHSHGIDCNPNCPTCKGV